jgi:hypothetical protein
MRITIIPFLFLILISCDNKFKSEPAVEAVLNNLKVPSDDFLGEWGIYQTGNASTMTLCNQCPNVIFRYDGSGTIIYPIGSTEQIVWTQHKDKLTIKNITANSGEEELPNGDYLTTLTKTEIGFELKVTRIGATYYYILRR